MSKTAHLPFRLQPFASVGVQNIWGHKWGHFANLQAIMIINSIIYGEISNPTLSARSSRLRTRLPLNRRAKPRFPAIIRGCSRAQESDSAPRVSRFTALHQPGCFALPVAHHDHQDPALPR